MNPSRQARWCQIKSSFIKQNIVQQMLMLQGHYWGKALVLFLQNELCDSLSEILHMGCAALKSAWQGLRRILQPMKHCTSNCKGCELLPPWSIQRSHNKYYPNALLETHWRGHPTKTTPTPFMFKFVCDQTATHPMMHSSFKIKKKISFHGLAWVPHARTVSLLPVAFIIRQ